MREKYNAFPMREYVIKYLLPGLALIGMGFWAGARPGMIYSFLGFISFFTVGVILIIEGRRKIFSKNN